jgi:probable F420-dependent oxidoreductase
VSTCGPDSDADKPDFALHVGFLSLNTADALPPSDLGAALEARGFESLWIGEHPHLPVGARRPSGAEVPEPFRRMMDPYLSLLSAASATRRLIVATGVSLVLERSLLAQAKQISTLDQLAEGRLLCGLGVGWSPAELANASSVPWARRYDALAEYVQALRTIWGQDVSSFAGEFFRFGEVWSHPKPRQPAGPPILIGGTGRRSRLLAAQVGDGWCPLMPRVADLAPLLRSFRADCETVGRDPDSLPVTFIAARDDPGAIAAAHAVGAHRVVLGLDPDRWTRDATLPYLDNCAHYVSDFG